MGKPLERCPPAARHAREVRSSRPQADRPAASGRCGRGQRDMNPGPRFAAIGSPAGWPAGGAEIPGIWDSADAPRNPMIGLASGGNHADRVPRGRDEISGIGILNTDPDETGPSWPTILASGRGSSLPRFTLAADSPGAGRVILVGQGRAGRLRMARAARSPSPILGGLGPGRCPARVPRRVR